MGNILLQLGPPLQVLYVVFISLVETKFFVDACIWDEFLVTAAVLERSTLASPQLIPRFFLVDETILFCATNTSNRSQIRLSAAPDARSLQDPAKDPPPRLKVSGRR